MIDPYYFAKKRQQLGMDRADDLTVAQKLLDEWYPGKVRAKQLHQGVLHLMTPSAPVASELRMRQVELVAALSGLENAPERIAISVATLR